MLSFTLGQSGIDANEDNFAVQVSSDGTNYTTLATYTRATDAGSKSIDIRQYASATTRVRFISLGALDTGEYWSVDDVRIIWGCGRNPAQIFFDAGDKVSASQSVAMARAVWASGSGTLNALAHELYPTSEWGLVYEAPVGQNTAAPGTSMFEYSGLTIMASQADTTVQIDANADGVYEQSVVLQEGGAALAEGTLQGARVQANKPIQVALLTGDINDSYESRDMNLLPLSVWGSSYWCPVGVMWNTNPTRLWLYNPSTNGSIYVTVERYGVANVTLGPVSPRGVVTIDLGANQGARAYASLFDGTATTDKIFGIGAVDTAAGNDGGDDGSRSDWSITLYPDSFLTTDALVGLGLGRDPTYNGTLNNENGSPLWVTSACGTGSTYVYVDWDNNGTADAVDTDGDGTPETGTQNGILVNRLQSVRLFEPPQDSEFYDQSGARIWSRTAANHPVRSDSTATPGCKLAVAWGQDPNRATAGAPGLDVGTSVPPMRLAEASKGLALKTDADHDGRLSRGDTATYNMLIRNAGSALVTNVHIYDTVPAGTTYVLNSTQKDVGSGWTSIPDDTIDTPHPLDVDGGILLGDLDVGETFYVRFDVTLDITLSGDASIFNCEASLTDGGRLDRCVLVPTASYDWGDLPDSYKTLQLSNGARHLIYADTNADGLPNAQAGDEAIWLGTTVDRDLNGQPNAEAKGDDDDKRPTPLDANDEDGVAQVNPTAWHEGAGGGTIDVTLSGTGRRDQDRLADRLVRLEPRRRLGRCGRGCGQPAGKLDDEWHGAADHLRYPRRHRRARIGPELSRPSVRSDHQPRRGRL